jgi:hypothetical protein
VTDVTGRPYSRPMIVRQVCSQWPRWTAWGALLWSAGYAVAGACWWAGASWYPFAKVPLDRASSSLLEGAPAQILGPCLLVLGVLGVGAATVFLRAGSPTPLRRAAIAVGAGLAVTATCLIPDYTMLAVLALWPLLVVFTFTGIPGAQDGIGDFLYWHRVNLLLIFVGGMLWGGATLAAYRRGRGDCVHCGRSPGSAATVPIERAERLRSLGRKFVWLAVLATLPYDITRTAWFLGWPLGLSDQLYQSLQDPPELLAVGLGLGILSTAGAALTHGLVAHWGETFPRWLPRVAGRPVPVMLPVIPAALVTVALPPAAVMIADPGVNGGFDMTDWGAWLPSTFGLLWAVGLGGATWTYYQRRRQACRHCGEASSHQRVFAL